MAVVRSGRHRNLSLRIPHPDSGDCHPHLCPPLQPASSSSASFPGISLADIEKLHVLGHGSGGTVYKARHRRTLETYALKVIQGDTDPAFRRQVLREVSILRRTDSPHVIKYNGVFDIPGGDIAICMEYMELGSLKSLAENGIVFTEELIARIGHQILSGLEYLHAHKIVHRDLKPANILVNQKMEIKISDFGSSKIMQRTLDPCHSYIGTCAYMSPERFDPDTYGSNYDCYAGDIWSLGLVLLELYLGHFPYLAPGQKPDWATLMCGICIGEPPNLPENTSDNFRSFIECCLQKDSTRRWTASQLSTHPFVSHLLKESA